MFSCEFYEISKNTFFAEHLWATACQKDFGQNICHLAMQAMKASLQIHNLFSGITDQCNKNIAPSFSYSGKNAWETSEGQSNKIIFFEDCSQKKFLF